MWRLLTFIVVDIIRQRPKTPTLKKKAIGYMQDRSKSFEYTLEVLRTMQKLADAEVQRLGGNPRLEKLLDMLRTWMYFTSCTCYFWTIIDSWPFMTVSYDTQTGSYSLWPEPFSFICTCTLVVGRMEAVMSTVPKVLSDVRLREGPPRNSSADCFSVGNDLPALTRTMIDEN